MAADEDKIISYLSFKIGEEAFAAHVNHVQSIMEMVEITKVPDAPEYMLGVINLRGHVLPVIDSRIKLRMQAINKNKSASIIVLEVQLNDKEMLLGIVVDNVEEVFELEDTAIKNPPELGNYYRSQFIYGMVERDNKFVMLLDVNKIFSTKDLINLQEASHEMQQEVGPDQEHAKATNDNPTEQQAGGQPASE